MRFVVVVVVVVVVVAAVAAVAVLLPSRVCLSGDQRLDVVWNDRLKEEVEEEEEIEEGR